MPSLYELILVDHAEGRHKERHPNCSLCEERSRNNLITWDGDGENE